LVNTRGEIVGINVALYRGEVHSSTWQGVGLAIPSNEVRLIIDSILASPTGKRSQPVKPGYLGLVLDGKPVRIPEGEGYGTIGVQVRFVPAGSPAALAGLQPGDIITAYKGVEIDSTESLLTRIKMEEAGSTVRLTVWRNGELGNLEAKLAEAR
jgi:S1-C subfamily serine protease